MAWGGLAWVSVLGRPSRSSSGQILLLLTDRAGQPGSRDGQAGKASETRRVAAGSGQAAGQNSGSQAPDCKSESAQLHVRVAPSGEWGASEGGAHAQLASMDSWNRQLCLGCSSDKHQPSTAVLAPVSRRRCKWSPCASPRGVLQAVGQLKSHVLLGQPAHGQGSEL